MAEVILTGFGDEIDASLDRQMEVMDGLGIHFIETRGIDGKNIADYTPEEARAIHARMADRGFGVCYSFRSILPLRGSPSSALRAPPSPRGNVF